VCAVLSGVEAGSLDAVYVLSLGGGGSPATRALVDGFDHISKALKPGGSFAACVVGTADLTVADELRLKGLIAGLSEPYAMAQPAAAGLGSRVSLALRKPAEAAAAPVKLRRRKRAATPAPAPAAAPLIPAAASAASSALAEAVAAVSGGAAGFAAAVIDEAGLLAGDDVGEAPSAGCDTKPRACKNCSCGRAELEAQADVSGTAEEEGKSDDAAPAPADFVSACGNCSKGDAFRCAGCPHRGKPAFKSGMGAALVLDLATGSALDEEVETE